jgi:glyoxylase-like metal-dependent hydrolase (beta-lactamase superfamily II)
MPIVHRTPILCLAIGGLSLAGLSAMSIAYRTPPVAGRAKLAMDRIEFDGNVLLAPRPVTVAPGVHQLGAMTPSAVYVIDTSAGLVLVDAGLADEHDLLIRQMADLRLDPSRVCAILLTHAHGDHCQGAMPLKRKTGARIYAGRDDAQVLGDGGPVAAISSVFGSPEHRSHATDVDIELSGDEMLEFGDTRIEVLATPGHTPGSVCFVVNRGGLRVFFGGDTISTSRQLGTYSAYLAPRYRGNARAYLATLWKLSALPVPDLLLPGHPRKDEVPQDPRIPSAQWSTMMDHGIHELEELVEHYETDGADFLDGEPKELLPGLHYLGDIDGRAVYVLATPSHLLLFDAPGGASLPEWLDSRMLRLGLGSHPLTAVLLTSCDHEATSGLAGLVQRTNCQVVSSEAGVEVLRNLGVPETKWLSVESLRAAGWIDVTTLPLADIRPGAMAYIIQWCGKTVLISGRMPVQGSSPADFESLKQALAGQPDGINAYRESLYRLLEVKPNLWLPAKPFHGDNANLYLEKWNEILWQNIPILRHIKPN